MKTYSVTVPIAGHMVIEVKAESADDAVEKALASEALTLDKLESWEALERFHQGNICYCPHPWKANAELAWGEDADEEKETT